MQYYVQRGRTYVNPHTHALTQQGMPIDGVPDQSQMWKLQAGALEQRAGDLKPVNKVKKTFDEATAALVAKRDALTQARRDARSLEQQAEVEAAQKDAVDVKSDSVKKPKPIAADDYKFDELDEGEES